MTPCASRAPCQRVFQCTAWPPAPAVDLPPARTLQWPHPKQPRNLVGQCTNCHSHLPSPLPHIIGTIKPSMGRPAAHWRDHATCYCRAITHSVSRPCQRLHSLGEAPPPLAAASGRSNQSLVHNIGNSQAPHLRTLQVSRCSGAVALMAHSKQHQRSLRSAAGANTRHKPPPALGCPGSQTVPISGVHRHKPHPFASRPKQHAGGSCARRLVRELALLLLGGEAAKHVLQHV